MSWELSIAGTNVTNDTIIAGAVFRSAVNGAVGNCTFQVRDDYASYEFVTGQEIILADGGSPKWGGYVVRATRTFPLPAMAAPGTGAQPLVDVNGALLYDQSGNLLTTDSTGGAATRYWTIEGVDYNVLFDKRVVRNTSTLDYTWTYAAGTYDDTIINDIYNNYLDISGDHLTKSVTRVGVAVFDIPGVTTGFGTSGGGTVASQGYTWRQVMYNVVRNTGGIYFISPSKVFTYCDVDTPNSPYTLTDVPSNVYFLNDSFTRTTSANSLGTSSDGRATYTPYSGNDPGTFVDGSEVVVPSGQFSGWHGYPNTYNATYQYDFWVPADTSDSQVFYEIDNGPLGTGYGNMLVVGPNTGGVWYYGCYTNTSTFTPSPSTWYTVKGYLANGAGMTEKAKVWKRGDPEPGWTMTGPTGLASFTDKLLQFGAPVNEAAHLDNLQIYSEASASGVGYRELELLDDGTDLANDVLWWGAGLGSQSVAFARVQDATSQSAHGRWQYGNFDTGIYKQATATALATVYVDGSPTSHRGHKNDKVAFTATVREPYFDVGQKVAVESQTFAYSDTLPIREQEITFVNPTDALYKLTLSYEVDVPWAMFDMYPFNWGFSLPPFPGINVIGGMATTTGSNAICSDCFTDTFDNRSTAAGSGWGTSADGYVWDQSLTGNQLFPYVTGSGVAVIASYGSFTGGLGESFQQNEAITPSGCGSNLDQSFYFEFQPMTDFASSSAYHSNGDGTYTTPYGTINKDLKLLFGGASNGQAVIITSDSTGGYISVPKSGTAYWLAPYQFTASLSLGSWYAVRILADPFATYAKCWLKTDTEPAAWQVSNSSVSNNYSGAVGLTYDVSGSSGTVPGGGMNIANFKLQTCQTLATTVPVRGYGCETPVDAGTHTIYITSYSYVPGTTEVYVDGLRQRLGTDYTESYPTRGQITFSPALTASNVVRVCYVSNGPLQ